MAYYFGAAFMAAGLAWFWFGRVSKKSEEVDQAFLDDEQAAALKAKNDDR